MDLSNIPPELLSKAKECKTTKELIALADETGIKLTEEQVIGISGGTNWECVELCYDKKG